MFIKRLLLGNNHYGFKKKIDQKIVSEKNLDVQYLDWDITSNHREAKNHCAAVTSTNLDIFFTSCEIDQFNTHYEEIGKGPIISFANKTKRILANKGKKINTKTKFFNKLDFIKSEIDKDNIVSMLLCEALFNWHWVICIGYKELENGTTLLKIIDNWTKSFSYYEVNKGSLLISATSYVEEES